MLAFLQTQHFFNNSNKIAWRHEAADTANGIARGLWMQATQSFIESQGIQGALLASTEMLADIKGKPELSACMEYIRKLHACCS